MASNATTPSSYHNYKQDIERRRTRMIDCMKWMGREDLLRSQLDAVVPGICAKLKVDGYRRVGRVWFDYCVDATAWDKCRIDLEKAWQPAPAFPWKVDEPSRRDMSLGISLTFDRWLQENKSSSEPEKFTNEELERRSSQPCHSELQNAEAVWTETTSDLTNIQSRLFWTQRFRNTMAVSFEDVYIELSCK
ncbi:hypothetical protein FALBO_603 [Fusarium albosuccineum]|uniref:Uncharacterized protein n=1 Tax=Fusarium albosuccineum TaxID=1237068 RepID=A0A8H4LQC8_9HYPO|nr:hypothetical protein FALBO_603 [Fusarium albosuccineum]